MNRSFSNTSYWWMSARARNASRKLAMMVVVGGLVFVAALIAFVVVPRRATRAAVAVSASLEARPDSTLSVSIRNRAAASIAAADSLLAVARRATVPAPAPLVEALPPALLVQRDSIAEVVSALNRLIARAENAPLPSSYRALAMVPVMGADPQVRVMLDSLTEIERERDAFGTVGGVDPVYVALTSRATAIGRTIQSIAEAKRNVARSQLAALRPAAPIAVPQVQIDTARHLAQRTAGQRTYAGAVQALAQMRATNERIDRESERARNLANVGAPPLAMLAAALVLALTVGFAVALAVELRRPTVADSREAEQVSGVRVLTVIEPAEVVAERSRRQADIAGPPLIDLVSDHYRRLYLHLAADEAGIPILTVTGDDGAITATVGANIAAAAAYEARTVLLVDVDPTSSTVANIFRIPSAPGLTGIIAGQSDWPEALVHTIIGRDRPLDVLPSGRQRAGAPNTEVVERIRSDFARMERRYDLIVIVAPASYVQRGPESIIPAPDVVLCARVGATRLNRLREVVDTLRGLQLRIHGLVLWNDQLPVIEAPEEATAPGTRSRSRRTELAEAR